MNPLPALFVARGAVCRPLAALLLVSALAACQSTERTEPDGAGESARVAESSAVDATTSPAGERLEATMVIGPAAARTLGYRIVWEIDGLVSRGGELSQVHHDGDALFTLDSRNLLCRVRTDDGARIWGSPVAAATDRVFGLLRVQSSEEDRVYLTTEGSIWLVDSATGVPTDRHRLARVANTASVRVGGRLVYGTRNGQIVWLDRFVGHPWRVRQVDGPIRATPLDLDGDIAVVSGGGGIMVLNIGSAEVIWQKRLLSGVTAAPAGDRGVLFVAGLDQYLWAFDQRSGKTLWKHFNDAPLTTAPVLVGDRLYQRFPTAGLACFDAFPSDAPDGRRLWTNAEVRGEVIGRRGRNLLVWDAVGRRLSTVDPTRGSIVAGVDLPRVDGLVLTSPVDGDLLALNRDGRLIRLVPQ